MQSAVTTPVKLTPCLWLDYVFWASGLWLPFTQHKLYIFPSCCMTRCTVHIILEPWTVETCNIWGFHGGDYEEWCLLGSYAVWPL
jgi:hypothetical protein